MEGNQNLIKKELKNQKVIIVLFFVFLIIFIFSSFLLNSSNQNNQKKIFNQQQQSNLEQQNDSNINFYRSKINLITEKQVYNLADSLIKIDIFADVPEENISAYDLILDYDKNGLEFVKVESNFSEFQVFSNKKDNNIFLTVARISQDKNPIIFNNQKILSVYFKPRNQGKFFVKIKKRLDNYSTKFVNEKTEIIYPEVNQIKINVQ